jgi:hypothetical protein
LTDGEIAFLGFPGIQRWELTVALKSSDLAGRPFTHPATNPIKQQKSANIEWKNPIESVAHRMGMTVNRRKNRDAEQGGQQAHHGARKGFGKIEPTETFEPYNFHGFLDGLCH